MFTIFVIVFEAVMKHKAKVMKHKAKDVPRDYKRIRLPRLFGTHPTQEGNRMSD